MAGDGGDRVRTLQVVDVAVGGDVHRVVLGGVRALPGSSVRAQMEHLRDRADGLRRLLIQEPYGAEHMCVDLVVPATGTEAARLGFVIMEVMGYPYYSGSNSIATATAVIEAGLAPAPDGTDPDLRTVLLEAPGGEVELTAELQGGRVRRVTTNGDDAFVVARDRRVQVPGLGEVAYDLMYTGGFYVLVDAAALGLDLAWRHHAALTDAAHRIIAAIQDGFAERHPVLGDVGPPPFLHFMAPVAPDTDGVPTARCATYGHPGVLWRCPTGTGTSARMALMAARGEAGPGSRLRAVSPTGSVFEGTITGTSEVGGLPAIRTAIAARPTVLARLQVQVDLDDPIVADYALDEMLGEGPALGAS